MRKTKYADELATAISGSARIERLLVHNTGDEEIRFSWWNNARIAPRPLDVTEDHLLDLVRSGILAGVFTDTFKKQLAKMLNTHLSGGAILIVALYTVWYNFVKLHKKHGMSAAMATGFTERLWSVEDVAALVEAVAPKPVNRGSYKKREAVTAE